MSDKEFVDGLLIKPPHEKAPDFVKCAISIKRKDLGNWLRNKDDEWINLDVKESKKGNWYAEVNNWNPKDQQTQSTPPETTAETTNGGGGDFDDDIPFQQFMNGMII